MPVVGGGEGTRSVLVAASGRPTFEVEEGGRRAKAARAVVADVAGEVLGSAVVGPEGLLLSAAEVADHEPHGPADFVVLLCATFSDASMAEALVGDRDVPVVLWSFREPGPVGDRLWLNSMCGANLAAHALVRRGLRVAHVHGDPDEPAARARLAALLAGEDWDEPPLDGTRDRPVAPAAQVLPALEALRGRRVGLIGDHPAGFTPCELDAATLERMFGLEFVAVTVADTFAAVRATAAGAAQAEVDHTAAASAGLDELDADHVAGMGAITSALRTWSGHHRLDALAVRCWPEFPTELGVCPCSSLGALATDGLITACERDVNGAVTMLLMEALGAGTTYLVDLVDLDEARDLVRVWHCGAAALSLAREPSPRQSVHCNRRIGVAGDFPLKPGRVTLARLSTAGGSWQLVVASGEAIAAPNRFQGNTADVVLDADAAGVVRRLVGMGAEHHHVIAWTDVRPALRRVAQVLDIPLIDLT